MGSQGAPVIDAEAAKLHLTGPRRKLLETLREHGPITVEQIAERWVCAEPARYRRIEAKVPGMVTQLLWRVENLGWVETDAERLMLTEAGAIVLSLPDRR